MGKSEPGNRFGNVQRKGTIAESLFKLVGAEPPRLPGSQNGNGQPFNVLHRQYRSVDIIEALGKMSPAINSARLERRCRHTGGQDGLSAYFILLAGTAVVDELFTAPG
jgi:hypothetical protein